MKKILIFGSSIFLGVNSIAQIGTPPPGGFATNPNQAVNFANFAWYRGGNIPTGPAGFNNILGTLWGSNIYIKTNNRTIAEFTWDDQLTSLTGNSGDGLRIRNLNPLGSQGNLDMFTSNDSGQNETHIVWGASGQVSGQNNRFEFLSKAGQGFWFDLINSNQHYKFATNQTVHAYVGSNRFWRIGDQLENANISAVRRLQVVQDDWQFRLSRTNGLFTDFQTNPFGNLQVLPQAGRVGINLNTDPTATMDVNGDARIRNVQTAVPDALFVGSIASNAGDLNVRRLDFTGNSNQVLLGNGTWGPAPGAVTANNGVVAPGGVVQLGAQCNNLLQILISSFTSSRAVFLNGNSFWLFSGAAQNGGIGLGAQPASAGLCGVGNTVEISANNQSAYGNTNASGLRFTKLTSNSPVVANGTNGVDNSKLLTVDVNGDVVLTDVPSSPPITINADNGLRMSPTIDNVQLGQTNSGTGALNGGELIQDTEIPMNENNLYLFGQSTLSNNLIIGSAPANPASRLSAHRETNQTIGLNTAIGGTFTAQNTYSNNNLLVGVWGNAASQPGLSGQNFFGGLFRAGGDGTAGTFGVAGYSGGGSRVYGVFGNAAGNGASNSFARGGNFQATGAETNYGVFATASGGSTNYAGYFDGDVVRTGTDNFTSDVNLKTNINSISNALNLIEQLNPVSFEFDHQLHPNMHLAQGLNYGFIAQEVETILPELVQENIHPAEIDSVGTILQPAVNYKSLNYQAFISILAKGMQEQQAQINEKDSIINDLNNRLTNLENCLSGLLPVLCQISNSSIQINSEETAREIRQAIDVHLSDKSAIILNQNVPNPFAERSVITYSIPANVEKAQIIFYDAQGKLINAVDIIERGEGQLNVFASDLSTGVYTYSLVADGKVVATKRMMKQE